MRVCRCPDRVGTSREMSASAALNTPFRSQTYANFVARVRHDRSGRFVEMVTPGWSSKGPEKSTGPARRHGPDPSLQQAIGSGLLALLGDLCGTARRRRLRLPSLPRRAGLRPCPAGPGLRGSGHRDRPAPGGFLDFALDVLDDALDGFRGSRFRCPPWIDSSSVAYVIRARRSCRSTKRSVGHAAVFGPCFSRPWFPRRVDADAQTTVSSNIYAVGKVATTPTRV